MESVKDDKQDQATLVTDKPETAAPIAPTVVDVIPNSPNPWNDHVTESEKATVTEEPQFKPLTTPDLSLYDQGIFGALNQDSPTISEPRTNVSRDVLNEFDPLANPEEESARNAWETSESHPPPPHTPSPPPLPQKDQIPVLPPSSPETSTPSGSSSFPSLAALARTFSIPLARPRPMSIDVARNVPSPATLSSFAAQQDASSANPVSRSGTPHASGSGTASPVSGAKDKGIETTFDFQKFLDQMKTRSADPVSKYLRSFLSNFAKRTFTVNDQVKIINDFLAFISGQMRTCDVWKSCSDAEFDNAMEGMEKLVMNRLYDFTFTPQLAHATPPRPITTDDLERDRVLSQRIALFGWVEEEHLDIPQGEGSKGFLMFAQQELLKINHYKAPRDKLICILNCCKVIFGLIRHLKKEEGADSFIPILIFVVLKANPQHLLSNVEFINRFRNPAKLQSEAGYYLSSLMGAVSFIETMDHTSLSNIDQELFEKNVEEAIQALPPSEPHSPSTPFAESKVRPIINSNFSPHAGEESAQLLSLSTPAQTLSEDAKRLLQKTGDTISKPLNAIGRIFTEALDGAENRLSYLPGPFAPFEPGREQRQEQAAGAVPPPVPTWSHPDQWQQQQQQQPATPRSAQIPQTPFGADGTYSPPLQTPYKPRVRRVASPSAYVGGSPGGSPGYGGPEDTPSRSGPFTNQPLTIGPSQTLIPPRVGYLAAGGDGPNISRTPTPNLDLAGMQAQIDSAHEQAAEESRERLAQIFPGVDGEVVEWVLEANEGDLGKSIEALLEMTSGT